MSSATLVVRQYETASQLSQRFGCALIDLITLRQALPGAATIDVSRLHESTQTVVDVLSALERALRRDWVDTHAHDTAIEIPEDLVTWLQATHQGDAVTPDTLARVTTRLGQVPMQCDDADMAFLERLSRVIDAHAAHLFQSLTQYAGGR